MKIFAIESSAKSASAALIDGGVLLGEFYIHTQLTHSETLMPMAEALLQNTRVPLEQVDVFAVSAGPGSFTGIRIGVAAVKEWQWPPQSLARRFPPWKRSGRITGGRRRWCAR